MRKIDGRKLIFAAVFYALTITLVVAITHAALSIVRNPLPNLEGQIDTIRHDQHQLEIQLGVLQKQVDALNKSAARAALYNYIHDVNPVLPVGTAWRVAGAIGQCARLHQVDPRLLTAVIQTESSFNPQAEGTHHDRGLGQITHQTARTIGLPWSQAFSIRSNACMSAMLLRHWQLRYGSMRASLRRYNGGTGYAQVVLARYNEIRTENVK